MALLGGLSICSIPMSGVSRYFTALEISSLSSLLGCLGDSVKTDTNASFSVVSYDIKIANVTISENDA